MAEFLTQRLIARLGAVLFVLSGVVTLLNLALPSKSFRDIPAMIAIGIVATCTGAVTWFLPWQRWSRAATLPLVPFAFFLIAAGGTASLRPWSYAVYWVVVFVWVGVAHAPWTSLKFAPAAALGYVTPFLLVHHGGVDAFASVAVVVPVCVLVGESLAWISGMLRRAERLDLRRMTDMESLLEATVSLARQDDPRGAADLVAELAVGLFRGDAALVLLLEPAGTLRATGGFGWSEDADAFDEAALPQQARRALTAGEPTLHGGGSDGPLTQAAAAPTLFLPLPAPAGALGLIVVALPTGARPLIDSFATGLARTFATQAGLAFERLEATQVLVDASMRDALTGVGNRRQADALLAQLKPGDAIALLDLDHFKTVNDRGGHAAGDQVLIELATYLHASLRDGDAVARYGGEEFLVVLRQSGTNAAAAFERLAQGWRRKRPVTTFSAGVAVHGHGIPADVTLAVADAALYMAKADGRDCVRPEADGGTSDLDLVRLN